MGMSLKSGVTNGHRVVWRYLNHPVPCLKNIRRKGWVGAHKPVEQRPHFFKILLIVMIPKSLTLFRKHPLTAPGS